MLNKFPFLLILLISSFAFGADPIELNAEKLNLGNIGLLSGADLIVVKRNASTPAKVKLDVSYSFYASACESWEGDAYESACRQYSRTELVVPGASRIKLDFSKAAALYGGETETITLRLSTLEDESLFTYAEIQSSAAKYRIQGNGTKIKFVVRK